MKYGGKFWEWAWILWKRIGTPKVNPRGAGNVQTLYRGGRCKSLFNSSCDRARLQMPNYSCNDLAPIVCA